MNEQLKLFKAMLLRARLGYRLQEFPSGLSTISLWTGTKTVHFEFDGEQLERVREDIK